MSRLLEIETAAASLAPEEQEELLTWLSHRVRLNGSKSNGHSVLDIAPISLGEARGPLAGDDDLLGEMLEDRL